MKKAEEAYLSHWLIGDRTTNLLLAMRGNIYRLDEALSCYRFIEGDAGNYQAKTRQKNIRDEEYRYICRLEDFGKRYIGADFSLYPVLKDKLICASIYALNHPEFGNVAVALRMALMRRPVHKYLGIALGSVLQKLYYRKVLHEDRPVSI